MAKNKGNIVISKDGPFLVYGDLPLSVETQDVDDDSNLGAWEKVKRILLRSFMPSVEVESPQTSHIVMAHILSKIQ